MLNNLKKINRKRKIVGRGGDRGGTSGKGHKGQKARTKALVSLQFEGGQTPLTRRIPKVGFNNHLFKKSYTIISLNDIIDIAKKKNIYLIDRDFLLKNKKIKLNDRIKVLRGSVNNINNISNEKISLELFIHSCSKKVYEDVEKMGGKINIIS